MHSILSGWLALVACACEISCVVEEFSPALQRKSPALEAKVITGRARIIAPRETVWRWVAQPQSWTAWIPRIEDVLPLDPGAAHAGWRFRIAYRPTKRFGSRPPLTEAVLLEMVDAERLVVQTSGGDLKPGGVLIETYQLTSDEDTTTLTHTLHLSQAKMPFVTRWAAVFLTGLLNASGTLGHVGNLKQLIEDGVPPPVIRT
jgi:hypothetical protein